MRILKGNYRKYFLLLTSSKATAFSPSLTHWFQWTACMASEHEQVKPLRCKLHENDNQRTSCKAIIHIQICIQMFRIPVLIAGKCSSTKHVELPYNETLCRDKKKWVIKLQWYGGIFPPPQEACTEKEAQWHGGISNACLWLKEAISVDCILHN